MEAEARGEAESGAVDAHNPPEADNGWDNDFGDHTDNYDDERTPSHGGGGEFVSVGDHFLTSWTKVLEDYDHRACIVKDSDKQEMVFCIRTMLNGWVDVNKSRIVHLRLLLDTVVSWCDCEDGGAERLSLLCNSSMCDPARLPAYLQRWPPCRCATALAAALELGPLHTPGTSESRFHSLLSNLTVSEPKVVFFSEERGIHAEEEGAHGDQPGVHRVVRGRLVEFKLEDRGYCAGETLYSMYSMCWACCNQSSRECPCSTPAVQATGGSWGVVQGALSDDPSCLTCPRRRQHCDHVRAIKATESGDGPESASTSTRRLKPGG
jgi:hypothetical protein